MLGCKSSNPSSTSRSSSWQILNTHTNIISNPTETPRHKIYNMQTYRTPVNPPILYINPNNPQSCSKACDMALVSGLQNRLEHGKYQGWRVPKPTTNTFFRWSEAEGNLSCPLTVGDLGLFFGGWREMEGLCKDLCFFVFKSATFHQSSKTRNFCSVFWCRYLLAGDSYVLFTSLSRGRPWLLTDPPHCPPYPNTKPKEQR